MAFNVDMLFHQLSNGGVILKLLSVLAFAIVALDFQQYEYAD